MSLLMDALKRAEKARQAEAAREPGDDGASDSRELSLHPLEDRQRANEAPATRLQSPPEPPPRPASESSGEYRFSLEDDDAPAAAPAPSRRSDTTEHLGPFSLIDDDAISMEDTGEMQPIAREAEDAVKEYFDEAGSMALDVDDIRSALDEDTVAGTQPLTQEEIARQRAHTVFDAKGSATRRRGRAALIIAPLFVALFLGAGGFFLWDDLVRLFVGPPPLVARRPPPPVPVEATTPPPRETAQADTTMPPAAESGFPEPASSALAGKGTESTAAAAGRGDASLLDEKLAAAAVAAAAESGAAPPQTGGREPEKPAAGDSGQTLTESPPPPDEATDAKIAALTEQALSGSAGAAGYPSAAVPSLRISRNSSPDRVHPTLQSAYDAFNHGDNARAQSLYEQVLAREPQNRNALLGIGAIATRAGDTMAARETYARLLALNPRDPVARAALIDSHQNVSPVEGESHIKQLLSQTPNQPFLYSTLGNLYARQGRWPEAQQAYFDAYRLDGGNADYAFNLAVSLDQMGQRAAALSYYRRALELAEGGQASFETQAVLKRIASLGMAESG